MKIGILETGYVPVELADETVNYPGMFRTLLKTDDDQHQFSFYRVWESPLPVSADACDAWVLTGGQFNAWKDDPWMLELGEFIRNCHSVKKKLLGICFGHQIIAHALGGKCELAKNGWGAGQRNFLVLKSKSWMNPPAKAVGLLYSHQDQVSVLPTRAELLGRSEFCPVEMYSIGQHVFCMQGHPEFPVEYAKALWGVRGEELGKEKLADVQNSVSDGYNNMLVRKWIHQFLGL